MRINRIIGLGVAAALAVSLAACSTNAPAESAKSETTTSNPASDSAFPVTIKHAFGETTITKKPERIATVAWANHEVPLALGIKPVGMNKATWGDDNGDGILPWVDAKLTELGGAKPVLFDETDGLPFDEIAATKPDVILAAYSGITKQDYETLSKIAPVIAYPKTAWGTSYQDMIRLDSEALGLKTEGDALIKKLEAEVKTALDEHAALKNATVMFAYVDPKNLSQIGFYTTHDPRAEFLANIGVGVPAEVAAASKSTTEFYSQVSAEEAQKFNDVSLIVTYGDSTTLKMLQADPLLSKIPAIKEGHVAVLENNTPLAASANPSPLSIGWGVKDYFTLLEAPLK